MDSQTDATFVPKISAMILFVVCTLLVGLLPVLVSSRYWKWKNEQDRKLRASRYTCMIAQLSAFGGGVLLSTTFLHLLPEIRESINELQEEDILLKTGPLPLAEFLMCLGFLLLYLLEEIVHKIVLTRHNSMEPCCVADFVNCIHTSQNTSPGHRSSIDFTQDSTEKELKTAERNPGNNYRCRSGCHEDKTDRVVFKKGCIKNYLLIFALSIHEAFEGLAIGLETESHAVWYMILGVAVHKAVIAFCIGVQLVTAQIKQRIAVLCVLVFASATSFGVAIGLFLYSENGIMAIILQGLATGTLMHVVFFELLKPHTHSTPLSGVFVGFLCMAVLKYLTAPS